MVLPRPISNIKNTLTNISQTSHFSVNFGGLSGPLRTHLLNRGVDPLFIGDSLSLLCSSASLPTSFFATADIVGNYTGVVEKMAHTRQFTQIDLEFYVDKDYKVIKFLEHWIEFIASGSYQNPTNDGYFFRMQYPSLYKTNETKVIKFERDYAKTLQYTFYGLFPISVYPMYVYYYQSQLMKAYATFNFDRYVCGQTSSLSFFLGIANNLTSFINNPFPNNLFSNSGDSVVYRTGQSLGNQSGVTPVKYTPGSVIPTVIK